MAMLALLHAGCDAPTTTKVLGSRAAFNFCCCCCCCCCCWSRDWRSIRACAAIKQAVSVNTTYSQTHPVRPGAAKRAVFAPEALGGRPSGFSCTGKPHVHVLVENRVCPRHALLPRRRVRFCACVVAVVPRPHVESEIKICTSRRRDAIRRANK